MHDSHLFPKKKLYEQLIMIYLLFLFILKVGEMEAILKAHNYTVPAREILDALAHRFR